MTREERRQRVFLMCNMNKMCVTMSKNELEESKNFAIDRIKKIHSINRDRINSHNFDFGRWY